MPRFLVLALLVLSTHDAEALTRTWPSTAPCNGTLQACVDASAANDTVQVAQNAVDETILLNKPFTLRPARGYRPVFAAGRVIAGTVDAPGSWLWQVEDMTLQQGFISLNITGGSMATVRITGNRVLGELSGAAQISLHKNAAATTTMNYTLSRNVLTYYWNTVDGALRAALQVLDRGTGISSGRIADNRVTARGDQSIGLLVDTQDRGHRVEMLGNQVIGGHAGSILLRQGSLVAATGGALRALVINNVVYSEVAGSGHADGINIDIYDGSADLDVVNNTVTDAFYGVSVFVETGATALGEVSSNLFAHLGARGLQRVGAVASIGDANNLFFMSNETAATPGLNPSSLFVDPMLRRSPGDAHLRPGSPAIDRLPSAALMELLASEGLPLDLTDGDGLRRVKQGGTGGPGVLDIGALEAGDRTFLQVMPATSPGSAAILDHLALNGIPDAYPQVIGNWNPDGASPGIYSDHPLSLGYSTGSPRWYLRQEDLAGFSPGARFNLFAPAAGSGRYVHSVTAANTSGSVTELDNELNGHIDEVLLVTRNPGNGSISDVPSPLAVRYNPSGRWTIQTLDGSIPLSGGFNVYFQAPSINAFRQFASAGNSAFNTMAIDHPLLNGHRCAKFHVTQATDLIHFNPHTIGVYYTGSQRWAVFNQDLETIPAGSEFHVVVDPQSVDCPDELFVNGFE